MSQLLKIGMSPELMSPSCFIERDIDLQSWSCGQADRGDHFEKDAFLALGLKVVCVPSVLACRESRFRVEGGIVHLGLIRRSEIGELRARRLGLSLTVKRGSPVAHILSADT